MRRHVPGAAQPLDVLGGVGVVVGRVAGRDGVGAAGGGRLGDRAEVGDRVVTGLELRLVEHLLTVEQVAAVDRARHSHAAPVDCHDRMALEHVGAGTRQPDRQLNRCRQIRARCHHQRTGVLGGLHRTGAHHADAHRSRCAADRVEIGVVGGAVQRHAGQRLDSGVAEDLRRAVVPRQIVLRRLDRRRTVGLLVVGGLPLRMRPGVGGVTRIGGQKGRASGQQSRDNDGRGAQGTDQTTPMHANHSTDQVVSRP